MLNALKNDIGSVNLKLITDYINDTDFAYYKLIKLLISEKFVSSKNYQKNYLNYF